MPKLRTNEAQWVESRQRWQIKVQKEGERRTFVSSVVGKKGKIEAERKADKWLSSHTRQENMRFVRLWEDFLEEKQSTTGTSNYKKLDMMGRLWVLPRLKNKRISAITEQDYQNCINDAYKAGKSKKTCEGVRSSITSLYKYARKCRVPIVAPFDLTIPRNAPVGQRTILQPDDIKVLFSEDTIMKYKKQVPSFFIHAWRFLVVTGLRRGELCGLKHSDIKKGALTIRRSVNTYNEITTGKTSNAQRVMALSAHAQEILDAQAAMLKAQGVISPWVFPDEEGGMLDPNHLYKKWRTYRGQHSIQCSLHELRHTFVSIAKVDTPEALLRRVVGHSKSMDTLGVYGHAVDGELQRAANILDETFDRVLEPEN